MNKWEALLRGVLFDDFIFALYYTMLFFTYVFSIVNINGQYAFLFIIILYHSVAFTGCTAFILLFIEILWMKQ